jgi:ATP-binding cassette subfamily B protein
MKELLWLNKYLYKYRLRLLLGALFVLLSNWFRVLQPQIIREAIDKVSASVKTLKTMTDQALIDTMKADLGMEILKFTGLVLLFALLMGVFMYYMRQTIIVMSRLIEEDLRNEIYAHYQKLHQGFYRKSNTGDLMARITEDVNKVRMYLGPAFLYGINLVGMFILVLYSMLQVNATLTFYALLPLPLLSFSIYYISNMINNRATAIQQQTSRLSTIAQEIYSGIRVVKSYGQEQEMGKYFGEASDAFKDKSMHLAKVNAFFFPLMLLMIGASTLLVIFVGGKQVMAGTISVGNIAEFIIYINMLTWPFTAIGWIASIVQQAEASQKRINEFLKTQPEIVNQVDESKPIEGHIRFKNVTFTYPDTGIVALKNLNFEVNPGEKIALVGRTGSGKSTVADLLLRMYDVSEGQIFLDGHDIREHNLAQLRQSIGYVPQDVFLFSDTVANNIAFGVKEPELEAIRSYAKHAAVAEDIEELPKGYETLVGERGVTLSGGQKQRVSIARALLKQPEIVILDDCLSAVDAATEQKIASYLNEALSDKTTIVITHRIYAALKFDKILVLDDGSVVESGTHEELLARKGVYADLFEQESLV